MLDDITSFRAFRAFNSIAPTFFPSYIPGLVLWSEADTGVFQDSAGTTPATNGSVVGYWQDLSGNGNHLIQATTAAKPAYRTILGPGGNKPTIEFDGVDDYLRKAFTLVQPATIFLVFKQTTWIGADVVYDGATNNSNQIAQFGGASPTLVMYAGTLNPIIGTVALGTYVVLSTVFSGASSMIRRNVDTKVTGNPGTIGGDGATIGARGSGSSTTAISVSSVLVYNRDLSASGEDSTVLNYLNNKWGVY